MAGDQRPVAASGPLASGAARFADPPRPRQGFEPRIDISDRRAYVRGEMKNSDPPPRVLIADDQADVLEALRLLLKGEGYRTATVNSPAKVLAALEEAEFDAVLMDLNYARDTTS